MKIPSRYAKGKMIQRAQYIAEVVCENSAAKHNIELPDQFWQIEGWKNFYARQCAKANELLKLHEFEKVMDFINKKRIYNLSPKWITEALEKWKYYPPEDEEPQKIERVKPSIGRQSVKKNMLEGLE